MFHRKIVTVQKAGLIKIKIKTALPFGGAVFCCHMSLLIPFR